MMKKIIQFSLLFLCLLSSAWADQSFVVKQIQFEGLQRLTPASVETYLPVKRGQVLKPAGTAGILRALYKTGFFDHISLSREANVLVIHVVERPIIGQLKITGNSVIPTDKLSSVMKSLDVAEGRVYNPLILDKIKQSLLNQYYQLGRYNAEVNIKVTPMERNRVNIRFEVSEGIVAKVKRVNIIGNHVFSDSTLEKQLDLSTTGLFTFFSQADRYSEEKLETSLEKLRAFYMDRGYLHFEVKSYNAEVTPDKKSVYINIVVSEGDLYTLEGYQFGGNLILPKADYEKALNLQAGQTFSRQKVMDAQKAISSLLGDQGYMFATIGLRPQVNEQTKKVILLFDVKPGKRVYVRHVTFSENRHTNDRVLRREVEQMEAAPVSTSKLETSKHKLLLLPFIKESDMSVKPVEDTDNQIDVNYKVKEDNSAQATFKIGYSQLYRTILGAGLNQKNFFGTGNTMAINLSRSKYQQFYGMDFTDPYYTLDGISRTYNLSISRTDPAGAGVNVGYTTQEYNLGVLYGIPVGQDKGVFKRFQIGANYQNTIVNLVPKYLSNQINDFVTRHGTHFQQAVLKFGYSRDSRDRAMFSTAGNLQTLFLDMYAPLVSQSLAYYTLNYSGKWYQPLNDSFIILTKADLGYGTSIHGSKDFPFYRNSYAGGIESVRGYQGYTLGPRDSSGNPFGANMLVDGSIALIFPNYLSENLRTSAFLDAGNVYSSRSNRSYGGDSTDSGPLRYSAGLEADWLTPFGPIALSLALPLNRQPHDEQEVFQFALGANF